MVIQQGQVFKLTARRADGRPLWAYRYRLDGRGSVHPQVGGFVSRAEAEEALRKALALLRPGGCAATMTLADLVEEYLGMHQGEPVTIAKLRWLLGKATPVLGHVKLADLSAKDIFAWRQTVPEGHRFEGDAGAAAGAAPRGRVGVAQRQPGKADPEPAAARKGETALRVVGGDRGRCRSAEAGVRRDGGLRRGHRAATLGALRARVARRRS